MRRVIFFTQDQIDEAVQQKRITDHDYCNWRAFQDGQIEQVTTAFNIYKREVSNA